MSAFELSMLSSYHRVVLTSLSHSQSSTSEHGKALHTVQALSTEKAQLADLHAVASPCSLLLPVYTSWCTVRAAAKAAAEAALRASQGAGSAGAEAGAGPSNSAAAAVNTTGPSSSAAVAPNVAGPAGGVTGGMTEGQQQKMLTFFGRADDCRAARQAVEQEMQVSSDRCM